MRDGELQVLLGHMGGPLWARKDAGAWSIPKGELDPDEDPLAGARREFAEELGQRTARRRGARARRDPPAGRQAGDRLCRGGRLRPGDDRARDVRDDVAAALGPHAGVPGGRSRGVVRPARRRRRKLVGGQIELLARLAAARGGLRPRSGGEQHDEQHEHHEDAPADRGDLPLRAPEVRLRAVARVMALRRCPDPVVVVACGDSYPISRGWCEFRAAHARNSQDPPATRAARSPRRRRRR